MPPNAFIAGGTDLIGLMKDRATRPIRVLDINGLPDMTQIEALPETAPSSLHQPWLPPLTTRSKSMNRFDRYRDSFPNARLTRSKEWGAVNEVVPANKLLARAREIAEGLAKLPRLTSRYTRIALTQKLRRIIDEGVGYGLALEGISAADVARSVAANR
jgi:hypothetical protein